MQNPAATLYCPNPRCQAPNPQSHNFCQNCRTPLFKRYLWAVGEGIEADRVGSLLADRYLLKGNRIILDTKPGLPPDPPEGIPPELAPYLKLSPYRLHVPQVYGMLNLARGGRVKQIWLLEQVPIYSGVKFGENSGSLMPQLTGVWKNATPLRQLSWLWQIANLWQPLSTNGVASSLLSVANLRVEGSLVRLLELQEDSPNEASLQQLGQLWSQWAQTADSKVRKFIEQIGSWLVQGQVKDSEQLVGILDRGLTEWGQSLEGTYQIFTATDKGPSRRRNEDACYPPGGTSLTSKIDSTALAIVCDGIGGHEGGDVASSLAIETIRQQVENLLLQQDWNPTNLTLQLEQAALSANDAISQRNNTENRQERQRMGTTLVMALAHAHEVYITHVGDSRVYKVTKTGCHQVTLDDDIASREVRMGYALYREALQQPSSGSLVQALGMGSSSLLHPTVQRFILDEDCVFLLCSDGLSDYDRVEQYWETEIVPILEHQIDVVAAGQRLIELANTQNGHDNVTVALVYCQVKQAEDNTQTELASTQIESVQAIASMPPTLIPAAAPSQMKTQQLPQHSGEGKPWAIVLVFLLLGLLGGALFYLWPTISPLISQSPSLSPSPASPPPPPPEPSPSPISLTPGTVIKIKTETTKNAKGQAVPLILLPKFEPPEKQIQIGLIPANSVLQIVKNQTSPELGSWLELKVCSTPSNAPTQKSKPGTPSPSASGTSQRPRQVWQPPTSTPTPSGSKPSGATYNLVLPGENGWIPEAEVISVSDTNSSPTASELGACSPSPKASPSPTASS